MRLEHAEVAAAEIRGQRLHGTHRQRTAERAGRLALAGNLSAGPRWKHRRQPYVFTRAATPTH